MDNIISKFIQSLYQYWICFRMIPLQRYNLTTSRFVSFLVITFFFVMLRLHSVDVHCAVRFSPDSQCSFVVLQCDL